MKATIDIQDTFYEDGEMENGSDGSHHSGSAVQIRVTINSRRQYTRRANSETWVGSHCFLGPYGRYLERGSYDQTVCKDTKYTQ